MMNWRAICLLGAVGIVSQWPVWGQDSGPNPTLAFPLWDGKEAVADYAKRVDLAPTATIELAPSVKLELVLIPAGTFTMGSPANEKERREDDHILGERQFKATITSPFYMAKFETTQSQYKAVMDVNPSRMPLTRDAKKAELPVSDLSWQDAQAFCKKVSEKTGKVLRLPTEAEWEFACRAGTTTAFYTGEQLNPGQANYSCNVRYNGSKLDKPVAWITPVGSYPPNAFGLYDMMGNVGELCQDFLGIYPTGEVNDPIGKNEGTSANRGEDFRSPPDLCRSAHRSFNELDTRTDDLGFRIVLMPRAGKER